jgi:putative nucleotidyltransferase with HDIG domain
MELEPWAWEVARAALAEVLPRRWSHVQGVADRARRAVPLFGDEGEVLVAAALLHDIGYAPDLAETGFHPIDGARYLRRIDAPIRLVNLVAHHSCAVLEAELRGVSSNLLEFDEEKTPLQDALWWADMTTTPDGRQTTIGERVQEIQKRYGREDTVSRFIRSAWPELKSAVDRTEARMRGAGIGYE